MTKGSILKEHITILDMYAPNNMVSKYVRHKLVEVERNRWVCHYSWKLQHPPLDMNRYCKDTVELSNNTNQLDIPDIYR
jgi:hypothetical protein